MKNINPTTIAQLRNLFPNVGGVGPEKFTKRDLERELRRLNISDINEDLMIKELSNVTKSATDVGLSLTVNDISRVIREYLTGINVRNKSKINSRPFPAIYKGVSYNPQTYGRNRGRGEWIVIFDFYSILRAIVNQNQTNPPRFFILDAGFYWIANLLGDALSPNGPSSETAARQIVQKLALAMKQKEFREVIITNRIRNAYLRAIAEQFPANCAPPVFSLKDVWFDPEFPPFLSKAIDVFCRKNARNDWSVNNPVPYERYMAYSPWVTPLAAAETIFVGEKLKVRGILSPTAETAWNKVNDQFSRAMNTIPFISWMYVRKLGKVLSYQSVPFLSDSATVIEQKLLNAQKLDPTTPKLIVGLLTPFAGDEAAKAQEYVRKNDTKKLSQFIYSFVSPIEKRALDLFNEGTISTTPLDQVGWLAEFPPGIC